MIMMLKTTVPMKFAMGCALWQKENISRLIFDYCIQNSYIVLVTEC